MAQSRRTALITGATGGVGRATALALATTGHYNLALHYNTASQSLRESFLSDLQTLSPHPDPDNEPSAPGPIKIEFFQAELGNFDAVRKLHEEVTETFNRVDVLFANAGATLGYQGVQSLAHVPIDVFEKTWRLNTGSPILLAQLCLPEMETQGWGRIIFCSSVAALTGGSVGPHYASSKSALHGFVHWLGGNVAKNGVTVNAVAPALITGTNMMGPEDGEMAKSMASRKLLLIRAIRTMVR